MESLREKSKLFSSSSWTPLKAQVATSEPKEPLRFLFKPAQKFPHFPWAGLIPSQIPRCGNGFGNPHLNKGLIWSLFAKLEKSLPHLFPSLSFFFPSSFLLIFLLRCGYKNNGILFRILNPSESKWQKFQLAGAQTLW